MRREMHTGFLLGNINARVRFEDLHADRRILKWILKKLRWKDVD
jgi:hypothetical protein